MAECAADEPYSTQIGPFGNKIKSEIYTDSGAPVLRGVNVNQGRFHDDDYVFVDEEYAASELVKFEAKANDVLLVHKGSLGQIGIIPEHSKYKRYIMGNSMMKVQCDPNKILPKYLYYWLSSSFGTNYLMSRVSQVGVPQIQRPLSTLREAELPKPSIQEQMVIVEILDSLDSKIELNNRINKTLEAMVQAIFKSWFVDFEPVKAKAAAKAAGANAEGIERAAMAVIAGKTEAEIDQLRDSQKQLLARTAALFPDSFRDTEIGEIPTGWSVGKLSDIAENPRDGVNPRTLLTSTSYVGLEHIEKLRFSLSSWGSASDVDSQKSKFTESDFLFGKLRPYFHKVCFPAMDGICSTDILVIRASSPNYFGFVGCQIFRPSFVEYANLRSTGTRMPRAKWRDMGDFPLTIPPSELAREFSGVASMHWRRCSLNVSQSRTLEQLRDTLLPRLLSGELDALERQRR